MTVKKIDSHLKRDGDTEEMKHFLANLEKAHLSYTDTSEKHVITRFTTLLPADINKLHSIEVEIERASSKLQLFITSSHLAECHDVGDYQNQMLIQISNLQENSKEGVYIVQDKSVKSLSVPAIEEDKNKIVLSWEPSEGIVDEYEVCYDEHNECTVPVGTTTIVKLESPRVQPGNVYAMKVCGINKVGKGEWSRVVIGQITKPSPQKPVISNLLLRSTVAVLTVKVAEAICSTESPVTCVQVSYASMASTSFTNCEFTIQPGNAIYTFNVSGLQPDSRYKFTVRSKNAEGWSKPSNLREGNTLSLPALPAICCHGPNKLVMAEKHKVQTVSQTIQWLVQKSCAKTLVDSLEKSSPEDREATLSTLKEIFDNIIQHPNDDQYCQIKLTDQKFSSQLWSYPVAVSLMKMAGWEEDGDYVRLRDESHAQAISELLKQELQKIREPTPKGHSSSSKCCVLTQKKASEIIIAIQNGHGKHLKQLLSPYHATCVKNMQVAESLSIIACVYMTRQIGIARLLVNEYGVDVTILHKGDNPQYFRLFEGCDATESCQSLIIEFIKELKIDVCKPRPSDGFVALHYAVLHKLFTVIKFLVEERRVNVNCVSHRAAYSATPLHMAYGIGEERIARYLIEHGADQNALDIDGRKPIDYKLYVGSKNPYAFVSQFFIKKRVICKDITSHEHIYFKNKYQQGITEPEAVELTFKEFPSLQETFDRDIANQPNLEATPTQRKLNQYITDIAPSYQDIGLELGTPNATLKLIRNDPILAGFKEKCQKEVWLENDTSATWKKQYDALQMQEVGINVLAEQIKNSL